MLVHEAIADQLIERVAGAVSVLDVGQADRLGTEVPPVIERAAQERVAPLRARSPSAKGRIAARVEPVPDRGLVLPAHGRRSTCRAAPPCSSEEIFGPLLAIERVRDVEEACDVVDGLPFALTGGLFARDPQTVRYVSERTPVGNLYVNRGITGAMVGRQPFGGNRLSGNRHQGRRPRLPAPVRRAARGHREHHAPRAGGLRPTDELAALDFAALRVIIVGESMIVPT